MFIVCNSLTHMDLSGFRTDDVYNLEGMFYQCYNLESLDLSSFNTSNVSDMMYMFYHCESLTSLDVSNFETGKVNSVQNMFSNCTNRVSVDMGGFDMEPIKMIETTTFPGIFAGCLNLTYIHAPIGLDTYVRLLKWEETVWYMEDGTEIERRKRLYSKIW